jgi:VanZ family protein
MIRPALASLLLAAYCALIFFLSSQSTLPMPMLFPGEDKLIHAIAYGLMGLLAWMTFSSEQRPLIMVFSASLVFCSLYGLSDEWHQSFVPGRDASLGDWLADTLGAALAALVLFRLSSRQKATQKSIDQR